MMIFPDFINQIDRFQRHLYSLLNDESVDRHFSPGLLDYNSPITLQTDEDDNNYYVNADLPGIDPQKLSIEYNKNGLTIEGEKNVTDLPKDAKVYRAERWNGRFKQTVSLTESVNSEGIEAEYTDGILQVTIPKQEAQKPKMITVKAS